MAALGERYAYKVVFLFTGNSFLACSVCVLTMGSQCRWGLGEGSNLQLVRGPQN